MALIRIAIIEDNQDLREELLFFLRSRGHSVWGVECAEKFWKQLHLTPADIILVDLGLPGEDGFSVIHFLHDLKQHGIIVMTARGTQQDRLRSLNLGADLHLVKPINFADLNRSITQLWQRLQSETAQACATLDTGWQLSDRTLCSPDGQELPLSPKEVLLLDLLLRNINSVCSKELLHDRLFGQGNQCDTHRVDVIISRLRRKARQHQFQLPIRALFGKGLAFVHDTDQIFV